MHWRRSSYSTANGQCVEVADWRKSTCSPNDYDCVETGYGPAVIGVRDTKQAHPGDARTVLQFSPAAWREFTARLKK